MVWGVVCGDCYFVVVDFSGGVFVVCVCVGVVVFGAEVFEFLD